jgi:hypothetical protein
MNELVMICDGKRRLHAACTAPVFRWPCTGAFHVRPPRGVAVVRFRAVP